MKHRIADLVVEYNKKYEPLISHSEKYVINEDVEADIKIELTDEMMQRQKEGLERANLPKEWCEIPHIEYDMTGNKFSEAMLDFNGYQLHASAIVVDEEAYLFSAPMGTGKSTHTSLWLKYLANKKPYILNDDEPIIRTIDGITYAYGTPFSGASERNENKKVKIKGICFLEQSKTNFIEKLDSNNAITYYMNNTRVLGYKLDKLLNVLDSIVSNVPMYRFGCNISEEAVRLSYETMKNN